MILNVPPPSVQIVPGFAGSRRLSSRMWSRLGVKVMTSGADAALGIIWHATKIAPGIGLGASGGEGCWLGTGVGEAAEAECEVLPRTKGPLAVQADPMTSSRTATPNHARSFIRSYERAGSALVT